jgi:hypothetical protein
MAMAIEKIKILGAVLEIPWLINTADLDKETVERSHRETLYVLKPK